MIHVAFFQFEHSIQVDQMIHPSQVARQELQNMAEGRCGELEEDQGAGKLSSPIFWGKNNPNQNHWERRERLKVSIPAACPLCSLLGIGSWPAMIFQEISPCISLHIILHPWVLLGPAAQQRISGRDSLANQAVFKTSVGWWLHIGG